MKLGILKSIQSTPTTQDMEEALDIEIAAFGIDIDKIEAAIKQHLSVANDQLKKVCRTVVFMRQNHKRFFSVQECPSKGNEDCWQILG